MSRVLVTGATGFIGPWLVERLRQAGDEVRCLVRSPARAERLKSLGVELATGDVGSPDSVARAVAGVDVVYHLAGAISALRGADFFPVNEHGVRHVAAACAAQPTPPTMVLVSSLAAAGPSKVGHLRTAAEPPAPVSYYGRSKRAGELAALKFADRVPLSVVRPPAVFGPGDENCLRIFQPIAKFGIHAMPGRGEETLSLIHAADLAQAIHLAAQRGRRVPPRAEAGDDGQGFYFVAHDEHPSYRELGQLISDALGRPRVRMIRAPRQFPWVLGILGELMARARRKPGIINIDKIREATAGCWTCDPGAAREELGFRPAASLGQRLRETGEWYLREGWL